jgi:hypothetical protein
LIVAFLRRRPACRAGSVLDVCRSSDVYAGDAALRSGCTRESLERLVEECRGHLEVANAVRWLPLFDPRVKYDGDGGVLAGREEQLRQHSLEVTSHRSVQRERGWLA